MNPTINRPQDRAGRPRGSARRQRWLRHRRHVHWAIAAAVVLGLVALWIALPVKTWVLAFSEWIRAMDGWGYVVLTVAFVPFTMLLLPCSVLTVAAGYLYGTFVGTLVVAGGIMLGATADFMIARHLLGRRLARHLRRIPQFPAVERAVQKRGFRIVLLTRLSPAFPFSPFNYAYGLTRVNYWSFLFGTVLGLMPGSILVAYLASSASTAFGKDTSTQTLLLRAAILVIGVIATILLYRMARRMLREEVGAAPDGADGEGEEISNQSPTRNLPRPGYESN